MMSIIKRLSAREGYHPILTYPLFVLRVMICRRRYAKILARLRGAKRIKVVFLSAGPSKWKYQTVYDEMKAAGKFELCVLCEEGEKAYYQGLGDECSTVALETLKPDIVFYQDPWSELAGRYPVWQVSMASLCCYVPYSIESIAQGGRSERFDYHHLANFHSLMYACYQWSEDYARHYARQQCPWEWAGKVYGFGHPTLDPYYGKSTKGGEYVIYAPHFGFEYNGIMPISSIGTFPWSGKALLKYAEAHPEVKWLFKPHPKLKARLLEIGMMTKDEVEAYYQAWERIGAACYDGNYQKWFLDSRVMITDSNSFLLEYMAVGKPLIHLVPERTNMVSSKQAEEVFKTFYVAKNEAEMLSALKLVVEERSDPKHDERVAAAECACVLGNHAGKRIVESLLRTIGGEA